MQSVQSFRYHISCCLLLAALLLTSCTTPTVSSPPPPAKEIKTAPPQANPDLIPVVRYGRYTLAELSSSASQRNLLLQVVEISLPKDAHITVGDGLRHVLKRSGYRLCDNPNHDAINLYSLPLPAAHLHLGPLTLHDALLTLAGHTWDLQVNDLSRQVCFVRLEGTGNAPEPVKPANKPACAFR
ncbi:PilL N-terminal domain-containing protein [Dickeya fangzhongdai]|uniref:PFGI-1 class ICE element type IV pilus protein PilL2 n=1 Tax=Dickeya fangzhongdai TaxID=1778540 RepID=UPI000907C929